MNGTLQVIVLSVTTLFVAAVATADDATPLSTLESRGLKHSGIYFLLPSEAKVLDAVKTLQPYRYECQAANEEYLGALLNQKNYHDALAVQGRLKTDAAQIDDQLFTRQTAETRAVLQNQRATIRAQLREIDNEVRLLRRKQLPATRIDFLYDQYKEKNKKYYSESRTVWQAHEAVRAAYVELGKDGAVKDALASYGREHKLSARLGPSRELSDSLNGIRKFEKTFPALDPRSHPPLASPVPHSASRTVADEPRGGGALGQGQPDVSKAVDQLESARDAMRTLNFGNLAARNSLKKQAITGLNVMLDDLKQGRSIGDRLDTVRKDIASLLEQRPMAKENIGALERATRFIDGASAAVKTR